MLRTINTAFSPLGLATCLSATLAMTGCKNDEARGSGSADGTADGTVSDGTVSDGTVSDGTVSDGTISDGTVDDSGGTGGEDSIVPVAGGMRKILAWEYRESVELLLGAAAATAAAPPADVSTEGYDLIYARGVSSSGDPLSLSSADIDQFEISATAIADAVIADTATLAQTVPCVAGAQDAACYTTVAADLGRLAFRRPLSDTEVGELVAIATAAQSWDEGDFLTGLKYELIAMLQAPSFLYVVEVGEADAESGFRRLTSLEMASRLSFFLLGRTPDAALLAEGEAGMLATDEQIEAKAGALIESPDARGALTNYFDELLRLRNVVSSIEAKDAATFPLASAALGEHMRQETLLLLHDVIWQKDEDFRTFLTADYTFVNDPLAEVYGMTPPGTGDVFAEAPWPAGQNRAGFLSQASFLTHQSQPYRNSPTKRGRFVQQSILCEIIPPPPPDVQPDLPDIPPDATLREILEAHKDNESCASCHDRTDEVGFAFEFYDAIGAYRTEENGQPINASGELPDIGMWSNATELAVLLIEDPRVTTCTVKNVIRGKVGHFETPEEQPGLEALDASFSGGGYSFKSLLVDVAGSPLFQLVDEPK